MVTRDHEVDVAYLLTQIIFSLGFAALLGAIVGWLLHGFRETSKIDKFKAEYRKQALALSQAETDNKMIEDDFRELKYRSEKTISLLEEDTKQLPELKNNLEKSQTLVRQLLQKHDAEIRGLSTENGVLKSKALELENREKAVTRLQMELNTERLKMRTDKSSEQTKNSNSSNQATNVAKLSDSPQSLGSASGSEKQSHQQSAFAPQGGSGKRLESQILDSTASFDEVLDKADNVLTRFRDDPDLELSSFQRIDQELDEIRNDLSVDEFKPVPSSINDPTVETTLKSDQSKEQIPEFADATSDDDLQQIFGIGPVTEKTLNSIGIRSFEQIAQFEREHIEYVAEVLQIFPGRIERDNWVASARKLITSNEKSGTDVQSRELEDA